MHPFALKNIMQSTNNAKINSNQKCKNGRLVCLLRALSIYVCVLAGPSVAGYLRLSKAEATATATTARHRNKTRLRGPCNGRNTPLNVYFAPHVPYSMCTDCQGRHEYSVFTYNNLMGQGFYLKTQTAGSYGKSDYIGGVCS